MELVSAVGLKQHDQTSIPHVQDMSSLPTRRQLARRFVSCSFLSCNALLTLLIFSWNLSLIDAKEGDRGLQNQHVQQKRTINHAVEEDVFYQWSGSICVDDECYEPSNLQDVLTEQLRLSLLPHNCRDLRSYCQARHEQGDCTNGTHMEFMHSYCPKSCQTCHSRTRIVDDSNRESTLVTTTKQGVKRLLPQRNDTAFGKRTQFIKAFSQSSPENASAPLRPPHPLLKVTSINVNDDDDDEDTIDGYASDLGVPQLLFHGAMRNAILRRIQEAQTYFHDIIMYDNRYRIIRDKCRNLDPYCAAWAVLGHCDSPEYEDYMSTRCGPICQTCIDFHAETKCPIDYNVRHAWYPGDLNRMFERILQDQRDNHRSNVTILSSPSTSGGPWILQIDDFLSADEADRLIELGAREGYKRSEDVGDEDEKGETGGIVSAERTSTNAWCEPSTCEFEEVPQRIVGRIEILTGIHRNYSEVFQLLKYEQHQHYSVHHDYIDIDRGRIQGVRILTVFMYLNDVEKGGGTNFPELGLTITPKKGRVVVWPSVLDDLPHDKDIRTLHQALPVIKGVKYGANAWIHQRHFRVATYDLHS